LVDKAGTVVTIAVTDANGKYEFKDLPQGQYTVKVVDMPVGLEQETFEKDNTRDGAVTIYLYAGEDETEVDFGFTKPKETKVPVDYWLRLPPKVLKFILTVLVTCPTIYLLLLGLWKALGA